MVGSRTAPTSAATAAIAATTDRPRTARGTVRWFKGRRGARASRGVVALRAVAAAAGAVGSASF
ncbi:hypothetical protein NS359_00555 [Curtobacterium oceanosedimentum]|uniref:Uncharacterized protein n=1 Tax=Curtobacterium oceanosedimentum TaxID=465820 RepID=A0A147DUJ3_9MICO|nr:hypothetical protein NS359_00555 [Curtobacterium oceanosedimentum]